MGMEDWVLVLSFEVWICLWMVIKWDESFFVVVFERWGV